MRYATRMKRLVPAVLAFVALAAACSSTARQGVFNDSVAEAGVPTEDGGVTPPVEDANLFGFDGNLPDSAPVDECRKMDIVFVVDDSGSMSGAQAKLRANFPLMVNALNNFKTKSNADLDYRLAVTSTDTDKTDYARGKKGGFVSSASCAAGPARAWLERTDPNVADAFGCRAVLGTSGSATEKPLEALMLGVTTRTADQNKDFLRDDALLAFFILTDEEDSSGPNVTPIKLIQQLDVVKKVRGRWAGAVISGQKAGSCTSGVSPNVHTAYEAPLLHELVVRSEDINTRQNNVIWRSICQNNFDTAVQDALNTFTIACLNIPPLPK